MIRFLRFFALAAVAGGLLALPTFISRAGSTTMVSVIVEFNDDPGAVYAAKAKKQGALVSDDQLRSYRNGLTVAQNQFLTALKTTVPTAQLQLINVKDATGKVAGNVALRYSLVYNGVTLTVPE